MASINNTTLDFSGIIMLLWQQMDDVRFIRNYVLTATFVCKNIKIKLERYF